MNDGRPNMRPFNLRFLQQSSYQVLPLLTCVLLGLSVSGCSVPDDPGVATVPPTVPPDGGADAAASEEITLSGPGQLLPVTATAELKGVVFDLEVARTSQQQALGLMFRSALPDNRGMVFPFSSPRPASFWMKDVPVALDMVFVREGEVIAIEHSVPPCEATPCPTYGPNGRKIVDSVIELRSGRAAEIGLEEGDSVIFGNLFDSNGFSNN